MRRKIYLLKFIFVSLLIGLSPQVQAEDAAVNVNPELEAVLTRYMKLLEGGVADESIVRLVQKANSEHSASSPGEIEKLDKEWTAAKGVSDFIKPFLTNECAKKLLEFQESNEGFVEIFVTDSKGLNVCQTDKTSDYYQADEDWWKKGWNDGKGAQYHGSIEFDQSANSEAISVFVPVIDPNSNQVIGVTKGVVDITVIKREM